MRNWQRAPGTIALFMKRHQNNWRIALDFKSQQQLQDNYPKWCDCQSYRVCGRACTAFVPLSFNTMMETGVCTVRGNCTEENICVPPSRPHKASNQSLSHKNGARGHTQVFQDPLPGFLQNILFSGTWPCPCVNFQPSIQAESHFFWLMSLSQGHPIRGNGRSLALQAAHWGLLTIPILSDSIVLYLLLQKLLPRTECLRRAIYFSYRISLKHDGSWVFLYRLSIRHLLFIRVGWVVSRTKQPCLLGAHIMDTMCCLTSSAKCNWYQNTVYHLS